MMNDDQRLHITRRSFFAFAGTVVAGMTGLSLDDLLRAEALAASRKSQQFPVTLDRASAVAIKQVVQRDNADDAPWVLRLGIVGDEVSGFRAYMGFDEGARPGDLEAILHNIPIVIHDDSVAALCGTNIVLGEQDGRTGFWFNGPLFERQRAANKRGKESTKSKNA